MVSNSLSLKLWLDNVTPLLTINDVLNMESNSTYELFIMDRNLYDRVIDNIEGQCETPEYFFRNCKYFLSETKKSELCSGRTKYLHTFTQSFRKIVTPIRR